ncbi:MAG: HAMP domain-containing histidine kinase [Cytophagales bacterium]|nr:HAMP domain-containing histidine kinase [Cytophagales bacterium]
MTESLVKSFNSMAERLQKSQSEIYPIFLPDITRSQSPTSQCQISSEAVEKGYGRGNFNAVVNNTSKSVEQLEETVYALEKVTLLRQELKSEEELLVFKEIVADVVSTLTSQAEEAGADIKVNYKQCPTIVYPRPHLQSILQNLLTNAIKFRDPKKSLVIEIESSIKNGQTFLSVKDNGLGFDSVRNYDSAFKPFQRFHTHES